MKLDPVLAQLVAAAAVPVGSDDGAESEGFPVAGPASGSQSRLAGQAGLDLLSLANSQIRRPSARAQALFEKNNQPDSVKMRSAVPPPALQTAPQQHETSVFLSEYAPEPGMTEAQIESALMALLPKELRARVRFSHVGPGDRFWEGCDLCGAPSNASDPIFGKCIHIFWAHCTDVNGERRISGTVCYYCNSVLRRRNRGFKLNQLVAFIKETTNNK